MMRNLLAIVLAASGLAFALCSHEGWEVTFENNLPFSVSIGTRDECWSKLIEPGEKKALVVAYNDDISPPYTFIACDEAGTTVFTRTFDDPALEDDKSFTVVIE